LELFLEVMLIAWISSCIREAALKGLDDWKALEDMAGISLGSKWMGAGVVLGFMGVFWSPLVSLSLVVSCCGYLDDH